MEMSRESTVEVSFFVHVFAAVYVLCVCATDQKESDIAQVEVNAAMKDMNLEPKSDYVASVKMHARKASAFAPTKKLLAAHPK